jgi:hypothetical protein
VEGGTVSTGHDRLSGVTRLSVADGTLVKVPGVDPDTDEARLASLLTLSDVYGTGWHAAVRGGVQDGSTVTVIGDGAVGLPAVLSAMHLGAERIVLVGRHRVRTDLGREFGATDVVAERGEEGIAEVRDLTAGGSPIVLEAVGHVPAYEQAVGIVPPGRCDQPGRRPAVRGGPRRLRQPLQWQRHPDRWPRPGSRLHRAPGPDRTRRHGEPRQCLRLDRRPGGHAEGLRGDGRAARDSMARQHP